MPGEQMDPTGSPLESGFSQQDTPCLLIEDSQPESQAQDDAEAAAAAAAGSRFPLLSRHLPHLLPTHKDDPELDVASNPKPTVEEEQGDNNGEHMKEKVEEPMDSSHLDTCGSISPVIEQLPQRKRTSRIPYGFPNLPGVISECRAGSNT